MKISTKRGDNGQTELIGGEQVSKDNPIINLLGDIDELNSSIGVALNYITCPKVIKITTDIQNDLFRIGSILANPNNESDLDASTLTNLEEFIILFEGRVPPLENFILPGGSKSASLLFQARSICRRVERTYVSLVKDSTNSDITILKYLNRLSDLLFMCARKENHEQNIEETIWNN